MAWHLVTLAAAGILAGAPALRGGAVVIASSGSGARRLEVARLRAHFDSVDVALGEAPTIQFTSSQRRARATLTGWLREYRDSGRFPRNDRFFERAMPFFRDSNGALCAMAYLIERTGRHDLVDRISSTRNNAFIAEVADDPGLRAWLDSVGLSVAEAGRIQPTYGPARVEDVVAGYDIVWKQRDTSFVNKLLAPNYTYFTPRGGVRTHDETVAMLSSPDYQLEHADRSEIVVSRNGPVAVVSSRWVGRGTYRGQAFADDLRCGQTWLLVGRMWELLSEHCVPIAPESTPNQRVPLL